MLALERLEYPSSIFGNGGSLESAPEMDFMVEVELVRRASCGRSPDILALLAKLPCKLEPGATEEPPHSVFMCEFPHCQAISGPLLPPASMSARCRGGGSGGGTRSLVFGIAIGTEGEEGEESVLFSVIRFEDRYRSEGFESGT